MVMMTFVNFSLPTRIRRALVAKRLLPLLLPLLLLYGYYRKDDRQEPTIPSWQHTRAALSSLYLPPMSSPSSPSCFLPSPSPWHPSILPYVTPIPSLHCSSTQKSLLYVR